MATEARRDARANVVDFMVIVDTCGSTFFPLGIREDI